MPTHETKSRPSVARRYQEALTGLRSAQKTSRGASLYSLRINRPAARYVAAAANVAGLTPNKITALSGLCSFTAIALLVMFEPRPLLGVVVAMALVIGFVLDSADGQLARLLSNGNPAGEWLDHMIDCATKLALHASVLVAWYRWNDTDSSLLLLPIGFQFAAVLLFFGGILVPKLRDASPDAARANRRGESPRAAAAALIPADNGTLCWAFVLWGWQDLFLIVYAALFAAQVVYLAAFSWSWFKELSP